ncbi:exporter of polyketide antibiotics [Modestobacter marinus]|uniref:ABC-2 type transport system permease protein n=1 Tax=Modestobacter marinus TaxID=477641 RepID=A0A846LQK1_9ACTN|nr:polyketide antibiotic transporter [Modestobacter marinus]NIH67775.1 ABC-2 type transport system permease protein [Modestobacter marinus]GGL71377.1 exporter of polyketide antibiotics [Modestobacter marinus]
MTTGTAPAPTASAAGWTPEPGPAGRAVTALAARSVRRGAVLVTGVAAGMPALVAVQHRQLDQDLAGASLAALAENPAIRTLFGPPVALGDPGGFTVWRTGTAVAVLVGVWAALAATRVTRGEEEAGRWDLLLGGRLRLPAVLLRHLVVLLGAAALVGAATAAGLVLAGTATTGALLFGALIGGTGMVGAALGALAAQLLAERRVAAGLAVGLLLAGLLTRMVADGVPALGWLHWLSPFGLLGRSAPFAADRVLPLVVLAAAVAVLVAAALAVSTRRDVGSGPWRRPGTVRPGARPLRSLPALAARHTGRPVLGWGAAVVAYFLLIGLLATTMTDFLSENPRFAELAARAGFAELGSVRGYVASLFTLLAVPVGGFVASRVAATATDEVAGRLTLLYSLPVRRVRWLATELTGVATGAVLLTVAAGLATWLGATWVGADLPMGAALTGVLNVLPVVAVCLGAAVAALAWAPSAVLPLGVLPAAGGYLLLVLADTLAWPAWVRGLSPFAHVAAVPAGPVDVPGLAGLLVVAAVLTVAGLAGYRRRDLRG